MIITKVFDIILNLNSINDIFIKDINAKLLQLIETKYKYRCYLSSYILNINKIINRSLLECNQNDLNCSFNISIQFEAECLIFVKNEVILNMKIYDIINNNIILKNNNSTFLSLTNKYNINEVVIALIKNNSDMNIFKKDDIIPIVVGKVKYSLGTDKITINAYPFIPILSFDIKYKISELNTSQYEQLNDSILKYIAEEEENKNNILKDKNNKWNYFKELIYPYKQKQSNQKINVVLLQDLINNSKNYNDAIVSISEYLDISESKIIIHDTYDKYIKTDNFIMYYELCKKYYLYLKLINELSIKYNTDTLIKNNENIFNLYIKYKH